jgi:hypothetical protein
MFLGIKTMGKFRGTNPIYNRAFVTNAREIMRIVRKLVKVIPRLTDDEEVLNMVNDLKILSVRMVGNTDAIAKREYSNKIKNHTLE